METGIKKSISQLENELKSLKNENKSASMSKYMKEKFSYFGVSSPERKILQKKYFELWKPYLISELKWEIIFALWEKEEREFQYIAIDWLKKWSKNNLSVLDIKNIEWLITQKSWWDSVDLIASNLVGLYFQKFPEKVDEIITDWRTSENNWLKRSCLIFQLKYKNSTNFDLLKSLIIEFQSNKDFFIQKAIGWSLRTYADLYPKQVEHFIEEINLIGLAKREALRKIKD
jgi:3-methyladenine DNA glycosylase AlkD